MNDVEKIIDLILSDIEENQELGFILAVSQSLTDEVIKKINNRVIDLVNEIDFRGSKLTDDIIGINGCGVLAYLDLQLIGGGKCISLTNTLAVKEYKKLIKLKEFISKQQKQNNCVTHKSS